jgi:bifunctional non-homologous end joining protein LigD
MTGVRAITYVDDGRVRVLSRNSNDVTATYPELSALSDLLGDRSAILDGEIVALEAGERPSFAKFAARMHVARPTPALARTVPVVYYVFDLLWLDGQPLLDEPYDQRRHLLEDLTLDAPAVRTPPPSDATLPTGPAGARRTRGPRCRSSVRKRC